MRSVKESYEKWWAAVAPVGAGPVQIEESKRAFYGGCQIMMLTMLQGTDEGTEDEVAEGFQGLQDEMAYFFENLK